MQQSLLEYLVCPDCGVELYCHVIEATADKIETGTLNCLECGQNYPIIRGIPRFVTEQQPLTGDDVDTANAFGWEWQTFTDLLDLSATTEQFLDWVHPILPEYLRDKVILDAGCGMGRFSVISSILGAKCVLSVDASDSVEAARDNACQYNNIHIIQADILRLPFRKGKESFIDFIFSIGVLHHMDDPPKGFNALVQHLHPGGSIYAWVYGRENNGWLVNFVNPIRQGLTSKLPRLVLYFISWVITILIQPILKIFYKSSKTCRSLLWLSKVLPYYEYFLWLSQYSFRHNHHVIFDHLVAPVAYYLRKDEFTKWFTDNNLDIIDISWRNKNSWRGHGVLPNICNCIQD